MRNTERWIHIDATTQILWLKQGENRMAEYPVSTAKRGLGEQSGSEKTPRGWHKIHKKIGADSPIYTVFSARKPTGEYYCQQLAAQFPNRDWILSRILWLGGLELGKNIGGAVDSLSRYIYIHGTPDSEPMGVPRSHGCIRMANQAIMTLFDQVEVGCRVLIE